MAREGLTTAFWSYAHSDDDGAGGQIARLRELVDHAFKRHSGEALESFFDRDSLEWGQEWRSKITGTISGTTFFIAILSPSYLKSPNCRDEFMHFWQGAKDSGLKEFLLPILWVPVYPETTEEDQVWKIAGERQYVDWTVTRKLAESDAAYLGLIDAMGERLAAAARELKDRPENIEGASQRPTSSSGDEGGNAAHDTAIATSDMDGEPELVDLLEAGMVHAEAITSNINKALAVLRRMTTEVSSETIGSPTTNKQRLLAFKRLAQEISPYVNEFERRARDAEEAARLLNATVFGLFDMIHGAGVAAQVSADDADQLRQMVDLLSEKLSATPEMRAQMAGYGRLSRDLRAPFAAIDRGFDSFDAVLVLLAELSEFLDNNQDPSPDPS